MIQIIRIEERNTTTDTCRGWIHYDWAMITTIVTGTLNIVVVVVTIHIRMVDRMRRIGRWIHVIWACVSQSIEIRS